jgi:putative sigma-54 modulation protein
MTLDTGTAGTDTANGAANGDKSIGKAGGGAIQINIQCRHCVVDPDLRAHCEDKIANLSRLWERGDSAEVRLNGERGRFSAEVTLFSPGLITRAEERGSDLRQAFDTAIDKIERQLSRFKKKVQSAQRRHNNRDDAAGTVLHPLGAPDIEIAASDGRSTSNSNGRGAATGAVNALGESLDDEGVVRVKKFALKPMSPEEASMQMDLLGHAFFVFRDASTHEVSVVYRRQSGGYGVIEPVAD